MFHRKDHRPSWICLLLVPFLLTPLGATTVYYDSVDWEANTTLFSTIDFNSVAPGSYGDATGVIEGVPSVQFLGVTGSTPAHQLWIVDPAADPTHDFGTGSVLKGPVFTGSAAGYIQVNLPADVTSFGVELMSVGSSPTEFTVALSTGDQWDSLSVPAAQTQFIGAISDVPIASLQIMMTDGVAWESFPIIDNFGFGAAGAAIPPGGEETPEVATLLLVGSGLIFIWRCRRRKLVPAL